MRDHRGQGCAPHAHIQQKNKNRIQNNISHSTQPRRQHADATKTLSVNKAVHAQTDHDKQRTAQVDGRIISGIHICNITGTEQIQQRLQASQTRRHQHGTRQQQHSKGRSHDPSSFFFVSCTSRDGEKRRAAHAKQVGKGIEDHNNGKTDAQAGQRQVAGARDLADIHAVHNIVEQVDQLRHGHGQSQLDDTTTDLSFRKVSGPGAHSHSRATQTPNRAPATTCIGV